MEETSYEKAKKVAEKLRSETAAKNEEDKNELAEVVSSLASISQNEELAAMYARSSNLGSENLSGDMPLLKIHSTGKSKNELIDGSEPNNGWFFYKPTKQQFESVVCHVLAISRGHYVPKLAGNPGETTYQHLMSGVFMQDGEYQPFMFFLNSKGHRDRMYEFGKVLHQYTHKRPFGIPMFALSIKLFTTQEPYEFTKNGKTFDGKSWVLGYEILKESDGTPTLVGDIKEFAYLEEKALSAKEAMELMIKAKSTEDTIQQATVVDEDPMFLSQAEESFSNNEF